MSPPISLYSLLFINQTPTWLGNCTVPPALVPILQFLTNWLDELSINTPVVLPLIIGPFNILPASPIWFVILQSFIHTPLVFAKLAVLDRFEPIKLR